MADLRWHDKKRVGRAEKKTVPILDTLIFCSGKMMNFYIAPHSDDSSLQEVSIELSGIRRIWFHSDRR